MEKSRSENRERLEWFNCVNTSLLYNIFYHFIHWIIRLFVRIPNTRNEVFLYWKTSLFSLFWTHGFESVLKQLTYSTTLCLLWCEKLGNRLMNWKQFFILIIVDGFRHSIARLYWLLFGLLYLKLKHRHNESKKEDIAITKYLTVFCSFCDLADDDWNAQNYELCLIYIRYPEVAIS